MTEISSAMGFIAAVEVAAAVLIVMHTTVGLPARLRPWVTKCTIVTRTGAVGLAASAIVVAAAVLGAVSWWCSTTDPTWAWGVLGSLLLLLVGAAAESSIHQAVAGRRRLARR
ncbi:MULTISPECIES: hypothetical protein [Curtobacterium]|jgi:hypothetical protein|uniref:Uncharacterized protein n=2 Tax=Curtobacterium TaxID=2034 RepID=A0A9Q2W6Q6_9MICO|nr:MULTISPECIES: hypothetical protein [Curtobacterium]MBT1542818.1 hypothetical protein [Curtobacterium flaccumfaciens pv. flaccumfaciens]MBT1610548.1 hypothetical protein [Curtobacterium flaccumfaciens pv. poinsettiae]MCS6564700.1 hypothetical protein [Curtobacterium flaccumfaciens pv. flaccumfaciens]MCU0151459.1 hypothetical protein [Curtobacterium flaccumfaciens pv. poinsettiae]MCX2849062.1 hypothetical protein [Curtobacterium flaccumfaciens pv. poinsettiae]